MSCEAEPENLEESTHRAETPKKKAADFVAAFRLAVDYCKDDLNQALLSTDLMSPMLVIEPTSTLCPEDMEKIRQSLKKYRDDCVLSVPMDVTIMPMGSVLAKQLIDLPEADKKALVESFAPYVEEWVEHQKLRSRFLDLEALRAARLVIEMQCQRRVEERKAKEEQPALVQEPVGCHPNPRGLGSRDIDGRPFIANDTILMPEGPAFAVRTLLASLGFTRTSMVGRGYELLTIPPRWKAEIWVPYTVKLTAPDNSRLYVFYKDCEATQAPKIQVPRERGVVVDKLTWYRWTMLLISATVLIPLFMMIVDLILKVAGG